MRLFVQFLGSLVVVGSTVLVACAAGNSSGAGGAGGDEQWTSSTGNTSGSGSGTGGAGSLCAQGCAKVIECGGVTCPPEYLDCSVPSAQMECRGKCVLGANCAQILSIPTANPDPSLVACAEACGQGSSSSSSSSSTTGSSSSSTGGGACSTCSAHLMGVPPNPPCPSSAPLVNALLACACQSNCPTPCVEVCAVGAGVPSNECYICAQTYCAAEANACLAD